MATGSISSHWPATAADGQEFELRSKRMGRGSFGTPKLSRSDVASSPSLATPSLPQRKCRANWRAGVGSCRFDDGTSISVTTIPKGGNNVDDELRCGSGRPGSFSKGLLVIALEEENDRLRGVLETERCARQLAEAEAIKQAARASDYEHQVKKLSSQLAEAQQKLADLEQAAFSRALVQAWLETAIPRRCASADQGPESSTACSAILEEPKPHIDSSVDVVEAANFANCPPALSSDDYHHDREGSASLVAVRGATVGKQPDMYLHGTFGLDISSGAELDFRDWDGAVIVRRSGCAISPNAHASSGPSPPVSSRSPDRPSQAFGPVPAPGHAGCQAVPCAKSPPRDCILLPAGELQGARTPEGDKCSANLAPAWSLPLQGEKHWPPLQPLLPPPPRADNPNDPVAQTPGRGHQMPPGGHTSPFVASAVSAHTLTAASIWMPSGVALCHSWGFESPHCGIHPSPSLLSAIPGGKPVSLAPSGPLLEAYSAPDERIHRRHRHHHHQDYYYHDQVPCNSHQMLPSESLRIIERSPRLGASSAVSLYSASGRGVGYGRARAAGPSFSSAPIDMYKHQDGGEWCNIPLGSPVGTPKNGAAFDGNI